MSVSSIEITDLWMIESYDNGWGYLFTNKTTGAEAWLQDDDATEWRKDYEAMRRAYATPGNPWHHKTWNACLTELCGDFLQIAPAPATT